MATRARAGAKAGMTLGVRHSPNRSNGEVPFIGLDVGYGYTKIVFEDGQRIIYPSLVAPVAVTSIDLGLSLSKSAVQVEGADYVVGEEAVQAGWRFREQYDGWWTSPTFKALVAFAARHVPEGAHVFTGLPLHVYASAAAQTQVAEVVRKGLRTNQVTVFPQGVGAFFAAIAAHPGSEEGRNAFVDIGMRTTEFVGMSNRQFLSDLSCGKVLGVTELFARVAESLTHQHERTIDPYEVDLAIQGLRPIKVKGDNLAQKVIDETIEPLLKPFAERILSEMSRLWGPGAPSFDRVIFCGGGALILKPYLSGFRGRVEFLRDSQYANACGYLHFGRWVYQRTITSNAVHHSQSEQDRQGESIQDEDMLRVGGTL